MRRFMMLAGLALVASLVIGGAAAASASAAEIFLTNAAYPQNIVSTDNNVSKLNATLGGGFTEVSCTSLLLTGTLWSAKKALISVLWHGCKNNLGTACSSAGQPSGLIHALLLVLPVWLNSAKTLPGLLFEKHQGEPDLAHFSCGLSLILVRGSVLGHIVKPAPKVKARTMEVELKVLANGEQEFTKVEEGAEVDKLETSLGGGAFIASTEEVIKDVVEFEKAGVEAEFR